MANGLLTANDVRMMSLGINPQQSPSVVSQLLPTVQPVQPAVDIAGLFAGTMSPLERQALMQREGEALASNVGQLGSAAAYYAPQRAAAMQRGVARAAGRDTLTPEAIAAEEIGKLDLNTEAGQQQAVRILSAVNTQAALELQQRFQERAFAVQEAKKEAEKTEADRLAGIQQLTAKRQGAIVDLRDLLSQGLISLEEFGRTVSAVRTGDSDTIDDVMKELVKARTEQPETPDISYTTFDLDFELPLLQNQFYYQENKEKAGLNDTTLAYQIRAYVDESGESYDNAVRIIMDVAAEANLDPSATERNIEQAIVDFRNSEMGRTPTDSLGGNGAIPLEDTGGSGNNAGSTTAPAGSRRRQSRNQQ